MNKKQELRQTEQLVEELLISDTRCRNSDKWLIYQYWLRSSGTLISFEAFQRLPAFETITRARRKLQHTQKKYLPTDEEVYRKRKFNEQEVREWSTQ